MVLSEAADVRVLMAATRSLDFCDVTLVCRDAAERDVVHGLAKNEGKAAELAKMELVSAADHPERERLASALAARRAGKKVPDLSLPLNFANVLVMDKLAHGHVTGAVHTSGDVVRSAVQIVGMKQGVSKVSSFFVMDRKDRPQPLIFADCAVMVDPNSQELAEIADLAASNFSALFPDRTPKVALLSFSTKGSASSPHVDKVTEALRILKERRPDLACDGELQLDAALVEKTAKSKAPGSPVAGDANILVFPNLDSGNIGYKLTQRLGGFDAIGPVVQGLAGACNDLSRGCSSEDVEGTMILSCLQAMQMEAE